MKISECAICGNTHRVDIPCDDTRPLETVLGTEKYREIFGEKGAALWQSRMEQEVLKYHAQIEEKVLLYGAAVVLISPQHEPKVLDRNEIIEYAKYLQKNTVDLTSKLGESDESR